MIDRKTRISAILLFFPAVCVICIILSTRCRQTQNTGSDHHQILACPQLIAAARIPNKLRTEYDLYAADKLTTLTARNATYLDPEVVDFARYLMDDPPRRMLKIAAAFGAEPSPQEAVVDSFLQKQVGGFFVEAGAYDGQEGSNTLFLEMHRKWTGLLVEMDPSFYTQIIGKQRNTWSINACLSTQPFLTKTPFEETQDMRGQLKSGLRSGRREAPCFPLAALLRSLNRTTVDYLSLDIEGFEFEVLRLLPLNVFNIRMISVEYLHSTHSRQEFIDFMAKEGYKVIKDLHVHIEKPFVFAHDLIFARERF